MAFPLPVLLVAYEQVLEEELSSGLSSCFDDFDDSSLFSLFHLSRSCLCFLADALRVPLQDNPRDPDAPRVSADAQLMVALNHYAHGISSAALLARLGLAHTHCPAIISRVSATLARMTDRFVCFPEQERAKRAVAAHAQAVSGLPCALGIVAAPHFRVRVSPYDKEDYRTFFSPLGYTAVVCQLICDAHGNILSVEPCAAGSASEQALWEQSAAGQRLESGHYGPYWLIAGKGYVQTRHVLTPVLDPASDAERRFNEAHSRLQGVMWATLSALLRRFKVLLQLGFAKEGALEQKSNIVSSCCVLHNLALKFCEPPLPVGSEPVYPGKQHSGAARASADALSARAELIQRAFPTESPKHVQREIKVEEEEEGE